MTREKKEILKKIEEFNIAMSIEDEMGCGFTPASYFEMMEREYLYPLQERLSKLQHYDSVDDMLHDYRGCGAYLADPNVPDWAKTEEVLS